MKSDNYSFRFGRNEHLKGRNRIREVFGKGKRYYEAGSKLFIMPNDLPYNRICFTFGKGKKFGNAVTRNRAKRLAREAYRLMNGAGNFAQGYDFIFLMTSIVLTLDDRIKQMQFLFKKADLFLEV